MEQGWIKVYRSLLDKMIWKEETPEQKVILVTLLVMATHKERQWEWKGGSYSFQPGQMITSLPSLDLKRYAAIIPTSVSPILGNGQTK